MRISDLIRSSRKNDNVNDKKALNLALVGRWNDAKPESGTPEGDRPSSRRRIPVGDGGCFLLKNLEMLRF